MTNAAYRLTDAGEFIPPSAAPSRGEIGLAISVAWTDRNSGGARVAGWEVASLSAHDNQAICRDRLNPSDDCGEIARL